MEKEVEIFWGGADIDPSLYGEENLFSYPSKERDRKEIQHFWDAVKARRPILGICRGHQLIAALRGGSLWQDITIQKGVRHAFNHKVRLFGLFRKTFGEEVIIVNSLHHQAVKKVPRGGIVGAVCPDGLIEALYYPPSEEYPPMVGVQWHPEMMRDAHFDTVLSILKKLEEQDVRG